MRDEQMPDDCYPVLRRGGNMFRSPLHLPVLPPPREFEGGGERRGGRLLLPR